MGKLMSLREIYCQTKRLMAEIESVVGVEYSLEEFGRVKAAIDDLNTDLWIPLLEHKKIANIQQSLAERDAELRRIRSTVFAAKPEYVVNDVTFLAWCHNALETIVDLINRSDVRGLYGPSLAEVYLGSILKYFQACLLKELKKARAELAIS